MAGDRNTLLAVMDSARTLKTTAHPVKPGKK